MMNADGCPPTGIVAVTLRLLMLIAVMSVPDTLVTSRVSSSPVMVMFAERSPTGT